MDRHKPKLAASIGESQTARRRDPRAAMLLIAVPLQEVGADLILGRQQEQRRHA
jgi:hypothetical protein